MGKTFENLTCEQLCDLMCGKPEEEGEEVGNYVVSNSKQIEGDMEKDV